MARILHRIVSMLRFGFAFVGPMPENHNGAVHAPRVLLVSPVPPPYGGIARWTRTMMDMNPETVGAELILINSAHRQQRSDDTTPFARITSGAAQIVRVVVPFLVHTARRGRPDCVHINTSASFGLVRDLLVLVLCRFLGVRSVLHLRFGRTPELLQGRRRGVEVRLLLRALKLASTTISIDGSTHEAVTAVVGPRRSVLIPNFINTADYRPRFERQSRSVLFLGSVTHLKGVDELVAAWDSLDLEGWTLRLVGPVSPTMEEWIAKSNGNQSIEVLGPAEHSTAMEFMYDAAFMVLPSHTEGFPNVVLEAMATGTPIIASAVGAVPQMLAGGAGIVVPPGDVDALRNSILQLVTDADFRDRMAKEAHNRVTLEYSTEAVLAQYRRVWVPSL